MSLTVTVLVALLAGFAGAAFMAVLMNEHAAARLRTLAGRGLAALGRVTLIVLFALVLAFGLWSLWTSSNEPNATGAQGTRESPEILARLGYLWTGIVLVQLLVSVTRTQWAEAARSLLRLAWRAVTIIVPIAAVAALATWVSWYAAALAVVLFIALCKKMGWTGLDLPDDDDTAAGD
jgi:hypothetical protein